MEKEIFKSNGKQIVLPVGVVKFFPRKQRERIIPQKKKNEKFK